MLSVFLRPCFTTAIFLSGYYYLQIVIIDIQFQREFDQSSR